MIIPLDYHKNYNNFSNSAYLDFFLNSWITFSKNYIVSLKKYYCYKPDLSTKIRTEKEAYRKS